MFSGNGGIVTYSTGNAAQYSGYSSYRFKLSEWDIPERI